jgi:hypothetical protein
LKPINACVICSGLLVLSTSVLAGTRLSTAQCNDYPFTPLKREVTHAQLRHELAELESVGYDPGAVSTAYPSDLERAKSLLQAKYARDCTASRAHVTAQNSQ